MAVAQQEGNDLFRQLVEKGREFAATRNRKVTVKIEADGTTLAECIGPDLARRVKIREISDLKVRRGAPQTPSLRPSEKQSVPRDHRKHSKPMDREAVAARQARRLESARRAILKEFGSLDKPLDCERLRQERRIFTVIHRNAIYVPSFQFDENGRPRPAIAKVIQILGGDTSDWGLALWFTAANGWLDGKRPVDLLKDEPGEVVQAAEQEAAELVF